MKQFILFILWSFFAYFMGYSKGKYSRKVPSEEEINAMAEKEYPFPKYHSEKTMNATLLNMINAQREAFKKGLSLLQDKDNKEKLN